ncbi:MAG: helix-turn-helix domain-containing protein [Gemmataceae bacterium]
MIGERTKLTPPELAYRWGISPDKVLAWIRAGELRAIDASTRRGRPRYLIDISDIVSFEQRREVDPFPRQSRRPRKNDESTTKYF